MRIFHIATCLVAAGCQNTDPPARASEPPPIACDPSGLSAAERTESQALLDRIGRAVVAVDELPTGYALRLDERELPFTSLARWAELERRCCPFFAIDIEAIPGGSWLRLTGGAGVKDFIRAELAVLGDRG